MTNQISRWTGSRSLVHIVHHLSPYPVRILPSTLPAAMNRATVPPYPFLYFSRFLFTLPSRPKHLEEIFPSIDTALASSASPTDPFLDTAPPPIGPDVFIDESPPTIEEAEEFDATIERLSALQGEPEKEVLEAPKSGLDFEINEDKFWAARRAEAGSPESYFSYKFYEGPVNAAGEREPIHLHYCRNAEMVERVCREFIEGEPVLGFDLEWDMAGYTTPNSARRNVSVMQIATPSRVAVIHLAIFPVGSKLMTPTLQRILEDDNVIKTGVCILNDCARVQRHLGVEVRGIMELSQLYRVVKFAPRGDRSAINRKLVPLATQVENTICLPLYKGSEVRVGHWAGQLSMDQIQYSANDAYACLQVYHVLEQKRLALDPCPPRPYYAELGLSVRMTEDEEAKPSRRPTKTAVESSATKSVTDEVVTLAVEDALVKSKTRTVESRTTMAEASTTQEAQSVSESSSTFPQSRPTRLEAGPSEIETELSSDDSPKPDALSQSKASPSPSPPARTKVAKAKLDGESVPPEVTMAEVWVKSTYPLLRKVAALQTYHMWYYSQLTVPEIATKRQIQLGTAATYILSAIKDHQLTYDAYRLADVMPFLSSRKLIVYGDLLREVHHVLSSHYRS